MTAPPWLRTISETLVAYAYAAMYPDKVERWSLMDAPILESQPLERNPAKSWRLHFNFHALMQRDLWPARERSIFDRIWNDFTGDPGKPDEATRNFFTATYAQPRNACGLCAVHRILSDAKATKSRADEADDARAGRGWREIFRRLAGRHHASYSDETFQEAAVKVGTLADGKNVRLKPSS